MNRHGFTLIELLISLTMLAFISYYTSQSLRDTIQYSKKVQQDIDLSSEVKAASRIIKSDLSKAFNTRDIYIAYSNEAQRERIRQWQQRQQNPSPAGTPKTDEDDGDGSPNPSGDQAANPNQVGQTEPQPQYNPRNEVVLTQFLGEKNKIDLTSISGVQTRKNVYASDLIELGYYLASCRPRAKRSGSTQCLWRRISYYLDGEVDVGGEASVLLEDVTKFELTYLRLRGEEVEWIEKWFTDNRGDDVSRNQLPLAVQVELEVQRAVDKKGEDKRTYNMITYIPIYFTNNDNIRTLIQLNSQGNPLEGGATSNILQQQNNNPASGGGF